ncbi:hypothetical protein KEH51_26500 [[Brevibacterium] frigoritolerans]|uniref:Uncharacterized protein n=1 Tax=Peribacillus frigoritolerans TaxID=450367 RepID=A0A941JBW1_9BACI|nr:hypothetical protein [Peribacillus frigoritolerans]
MATVFSLKRSSISEIRSLSARGKGVPVVEINVSFTNPQKDVSASFPQSVADFIKQ